MNIKKFLSNHTYVILPTKANPKVYLPIADFKTVANAFELYNPFSLKARLLKKLAYFLCLNMKPVARMFLPTLSGKKTDFVVFLEKELSKNITSSAYIATAKDKIVLQLQDKNEIIGYLKYPISELGKQRLHNEQKAIGLLSEKNIIPPLRLKGEFEGCPFILLEPIHGDIGSVTEEEYAVVLNSLKKEESLLLKSHPRAISLLRQLSELNLTALKNIFEKNLEVSKKKYSLVYEHGDFAPWNLIKTANGIVPFDFEYFEENGLEHLDELKFHFQEQHLLHQKAGIDLIKAIASKVHIAEFDCIFQFFLLKEIVNKTKINEPIHLEHSLLNLLPRI